MKHSDFSMNYVLETEMEWSSTVDELSSKTLIAKEQLVAENQINTGYRDI